jgi:hypothetical protein
MTSSTNVRNIIVLVLLTFLADEVCLGLPVPTQAPLDAHREINAQHNPGLIDRTTLTPTNTTNAASTTPITRPTRLADPDPNSNMNKLANAPPTNNSTTTDRDSGAPSGSRKPDGSSSDHDDDDDDNDDDDDHDDDNDDEDDDDDWSQDPNDDVSTVQTLLRPLRPQTKA